MTKGRKRRLAGGGMFEAHLALASADNSSKGHADTVSRKQVGDQVQALSVQQSTPNAAEHQH